MTIAAGVASAARALGRIVLGVPDLARAAAAMFRARRVVNTTPRGRLVAEASRGMADDRPVHPDDIHRARRLGTALRVASSVAPSRLTCLVRAIAMQDLLRREGRPAGSIRIGVRRDADRFEAHAWVELGGVPVGDDGRLAERFALLQGAHVEAAP